MNNKDKQKIDNISTPQCQFFMVRKKRPCRMTVRPGRQYCGEHEPQPTTPNGEVDRRIPCPNDPKHTCYVSKLRRHLFVCNARPVEQPPHIVHNINAPEDSETYIRRPLSEIPKETVAQVIEKVNSFYNKYIEGNISIVPDKPIHPAVLEEFNEPNRTESSLKHLRQASSLLWLIEGEGLVRNQTCYVELGAGKGKLSYYMGLAWCDNVTEDSDAEGRGSCVLAVDRAAPRHKRDNKLAHAARIRADLAHLALRHAEPARGKTLVALAKHLCGVATDFALRCVVSGGARGAALATCCHHRCERQLHVGARHLQELGINGDDLNIMLGIVSWATCGNGMSRERRNKEKQDKETAIVETINNQEDEKHLILPQEYREQVGRKTKAILDWGRVLYLQQHGYEARLCHFVPASVSPENFCIVAKKIDL